MFSRAARRTCTLHVSGLQTAECCDRYKRRPATSRTTLDTARILRPSPDVPVAIMMFTSKILPAVGLIVGLAMGVVSQTLSAVIISVDRASAALLSVDKQVQQITKDSAVEQIPVCRSNAGPGETLTLRAVTQSIKEGFDGIIDLLLSQEQTGLKDVSEPPVSASLLRGSSASRRR
ncbi:hypothetical protein OH77DRAFT_342967 [Trametes cingulata]|nr:hypothetical protein OH77DRAFT_342967 [Trametes cingulata]